VLLFFCAD